MSTGVVAEIKIPNQDMYNPIFFNFLFPGLFRLSSNAGSTFSSGVT